MKKDCIAILAVILMGAFSLPGVFGEVNFSGLDLMEDDRLLFRGTSVSGGSAPQSAVFLSALPEMSIRQLTAFPEIITLVDSGRTLQINNAFGPVRLPLSGGLPEQIPGFPSFTGGAAVIGGRVEGMAASPDGRWLLVVEPVSPAYGNLVLVDTGTGDKTPIASGIERPDSIFPAAWAPDSRVFVYTRGGRLYYHTVNADFFPQAVNEQFRLIGEGSAASVFWGSDGVFYYIKGSIVYRVRGADLFARTLYTDFLEIGAVAGKISFEFNPNFDRFWISPDSKAILLAQGGRNIFYFLLNRDDYNGGSESSLPYLMLPRSSFGVSVLWSPGGQVTVLARVAGTEGMNIWRLSSGREGMAFTKLNVPQEGGRNVRNGFSGAALSPDGSKALFWGADGVILLDYINWKPLVTLSSRKGYSCLWAGIDECIIGDENRIERVMVKDGTVTGRNLVCLSSGSEAGFEDRTGRILVRNGASWFVSDGKTNWTETSNAIVRRASLVSPSYRVYLEKQSGGPYGNLPMIRNLVTVGTMPLLPDFPRASAPSTAEVAPPDTPSGNQDIFSHGKYSGLREISLCFDLYDDAEGLPAVLDALTRFGMKATFFLNGEFIRRHSSAARDIAEAGHEAASMFFAPINFTDSRYRISEDFVTRGLARNEDEFFQATGRELALLWHAPWYAASKEVIEAASKAGYKTIGADVDPMDWVRRDDVKRIGLSQYSAADMINRIMEQTRNGSIVPVRLGLLPEGRSDYLFNNINVLLDALVRSGFSVVPVSLLIDHSK
ncbi:MAG: putative polysaccharide deacetylase family protein [Treponematales bacterium]